MSQFVSPDAAALLDVNYLLEDGVSVTTNISDSALYTGFKLENILRKERWKKFRSSSYGSFTVDLGTTRRPTVFAVIDTDSAVNTISNWILEASNDPDFTNDGDTSYWSFHQNVKNGFSFYLGSDVPVGVWRWNNSGTTEKIAGLHQTNDGKILIFKKNNTNLNTIDAARITPEAQIDTSFGTDGYGTASGSGTTIKVKYTLPVGDGDCHVLTDVNDVILKMKDNGTLNTTDWSPNGWASLTNITKPTFLVIQSTGHVVACGKKTNACHVERFDTSGSQTHSTALTWSGAAYNYDNIGGADVDSSNNVYVAGHTGDIDEYTCAVAKFDSNLTLDTAFNTNGKLEFNFSSEDEIGAYGKACCCGVDSKNNIVVMCVGYHSVNRSGYTTNRSAYWCLAKINSSGSFVTSFGNSGKVSFPELYADIGVTFDDYNYRGHMDSQDRFIVAGIASRGGAQQLAVARFDHQGSLDISFGEDGIFWTGMGNEAIGMTTLDDGSMLITTDEYVLKITKNGAFDRSFHTISDNESKRYWKFSPQLADDELYFGYVHLGTYVDIRPEPRTTISVIHNSNTFKALNSDSTSDRINGMREVNFTTKDMTREELCALRDTLDLRGAHTPMIIDLLTRSTFSEDREYGLFYGLVSENSGVRVVRSSAFGENFRLRFEESF